MVACSILVVEDEESLRVLLKLVLETAGYTVQTAANGRQARAMCAAGRFDVVLTDLLMPECDGLELIAELVKKNPSPRIVAMSGGGHVMGDQYLMMARSFGAHSMLPKPFTNDVLFAAIEQARAVTRTVV